MLIDARSVGQDRRFDCDLCIVGAGPAGIAIVDRLRDSGLSLLLLESGGFNLERPTQKLYRGEIVGQDYFRLDACRWRLFGGGSNRWGGWCRPLEAVDYARHEWLENSGWPIGPDALRPYEADAAELFELTGPRFDLDAWQDRMPQPWPLKGSNFENIVFQFSPQTNFADLYRRRVIQADNVTTLIHANLTSIRLDPGSRRVGALTVSTLTGRTLNVRPKAAVLATGGIENARLLLASQLDQVEGLGNEFDAVGRYFMEHLHVPAGHILMGAETRNSAFYRKAFYGPAEMRGLLAPTEQARRHYKLLGTSIALEPPRYYFGTPFVGWPPSITFGPVRMYKRFRTGRLRPLVERLKNFADHAYTLPQRLHTSRLARLAIARTGQRGSYDRMAGLYIRAEQSPDAANRVTRSGQIDALGMPETRLEWRVRSSDTDSIISWLNIFDRDLRERSLGEVIAPADGWEDGIIGGPHHMGSTRMSADPRHGVVNADCRLHSVDNLYIAGSSVFTTGGYPNPTFTLVTLALRLADTLRRRMAKPL